MIRDGQSVMAPGRVADCFQSHSIGADWDPVANYLSNQRGSVPLGPTFLAGKQDWKLGFLQALPASKIGSSASFRPCRQARSEARLPSGLAGKQGRKLGFLQALPASKIGSSASSSPCRQATENAQTADRCSTDSKTEARVPFGAFKVEKTEARVPDLLAGKQIRTLGLLHALPASNQDAGVGICHTRRAHRARQLALRE